LWGEESQFWPLFVKLIIYMYRERERREERKKRKEEK